MQEPTELELQHIGGLYDPIKAHQYYLRTRQLKGRRRGRGDDSSSSNGRIAGSDPRLGKAMGQIHREARAKQRQELATRIQSLEGKLKKLEAKIREMEIQEASEDRKGEAKKERAAKERDKPKSAAEKAEAARESEKYRREHQQELKTKAKKASDESGGGSSSKKKSGSKTNSVSALKTLSTKVKGQIAVAKQKLAAL